MSAGIFLPKYHTTLTARYSDNHGYNNECILQLEEILGLKTSKLHSQVNSSMMAISNLL